MAPTTNTKQRTGRHDSRHQGRLTAEPIMRILCMKTNTVVGYLYHWNNGDLQPAWLDEAMAEVRYEPLLDAA